MCMNAWTDMSWFNGRVTDLNATALPHAISGLPNCSIWISWATNTWLWYVCYFELGFFLVHVSEAGDLRVSIH